MNPENVTPLRSSGPLRPVSRQGVSLAFGLDLDEDDALIVRWPDGSIERIDLGLGDDR